MITREKTHAGVAKKNSAEKIAPPKQVPPKKFRLGFNDISWNDVQGKIKSIRAEMENLCWLMKEAGIKEIDASQLLSDPFKTVLPHMPESFQTLADSLSDPDLLNWDRFPVYRDIVKWARKNSHNVDLLNYHSFYKLNGQSTIDESKITQLKESLTRYTQGERQTAVAKKIQQAIDLLNQAQEIAGDRWISQYPSPSEIALPFKAEGRKYILNEAFISNY